MNLHLNIDALLEPHLLQSHVRHIKPQGTTLNFGATTRNITCTSNGYTCAHTGSFLKAEAEHDPITRL